MDLIQTRVVLPGKHGRDILCDVTRFQENKSLPVVVFAHGFKGYKDWGHFNLMARYFAEQGYAFVKFNFSHNGGTVSDGIDFPDLEAFGQNTFTKELSDLGQVLDFVSGEINPLNSIDKALQRSFDTKNISLMGHSRGGGISCIYARKDSRVRRLITLAAVSDFKARFPFGERLELWREKGVEYIENARTMQQMPLYFELYEDFEKNEQDYNIQAAVRSLVIPHLIIHGAEDQVVKIEEGEAMYEWSRGRFNSNSASQVDFQIVPGGDHVFSSSHPYELKELNEMLLSVCKSVVSFLSK